MGRKATGPGETWIAGLPKKQEPTAGGYCFKYKGAEPFRGGNEK